MSDGLGLGAVPVLRGSPGWRDCCEASGYLARQVFNVFPPESTDHFVQRKETEYDVADIASQ